MNKNNLIVIIFLLSFFSAKAQIKDTTAKWILKQISDKTKQYTSVKIEFTYKYENEKNKISEVKEGDIIIQGNKYRMNVAGQLIINDGTTVWTYLKDAEEVTINKFKETKESITPQKIISDYNKDFKPKLIREYTEKGKTYMIIDLTPNISRSFYKVRIIVDKGLQQVKSSVFFEKEGNKFSYEVKKFIPNVKIDDQMFSFDPKDYPGVEINDMR